MSRIFKSIFNFLASLKLAVIVILGLAYVLALGTIYESLYGTPIAKEKVYGTVWFSVLLLFLGINVFCAALSRYPWKKHHTGFVITHLGIITILIGSFITQKWGVDGSMALAEGEAGDRVVLSESLLQVAIPDLGIVETWNAKFKENKEDKSIIWSKNLKDKSRMIVDRYYRHANSTLKVVEGASEINPALKVSLKNLPMGGEALSEWIFEKENIYAPNNVRIGPAKISFINPEALNQLRPEASSLLQDKMGKVELVLPEGKKIEFSAKAALDGEISLEEGRYKVKGLRYLPDALVKEGKLVSRSENPNNPAYEFEISGPDFQETHLIFARFPDLAAVHGKQQKSGIKSFFKAEQGMQALGQAELYLAVNASGEILYRIRSKQGLSETQKTKVGETKATGWMTIQFQIEEYVTHAQAEFQYREVKLKKGVTEGPPPAIHVVIQKDKAEADAWLLQGDMRVLTIEGSPYVVRYGLKSYPLGFKVKLDKFQVLQYPGTNSPSAFESYVTVENEKTGAKFDTKIHMNNPLDYQGYTFYQSSYQENPGEPTISIFSVGRDPGTPVKYAGSILMVGGIALMFWFKPMFVQKKAKAKKEGLEPLG